MALYTITNLREEIPFEACGDAIHRTIQNAKNLIMTHMGEVPFDRLRGFDMALYNLPMAQFRAALPKEIDRVLLWEPNVTMISAEADMVKVENNPTMDKDVLITVVIDVKIPE